MVEKMRRFFSPPVFEDEGVNFNARNLNVILLMAFATLVVTILRFLALGKFWQGKAGVIFLATSFVVVAAYILFQKRYILTSSVMTIGILTLLPFMLILMSGNGIHDTASMILPVVVIIASMLLPWRGLAGYVLFVALTFGVLVRMEVNRNLVTPFSSLTTNSDFTDALTILSAAALMSGLLATSLRRNLRQLGNALKERELSEERYRLISNLSSDYVFSSTVHKDGTITHDWQSGAFESISGYTPEEFLAHGGWRATLYPDDLTVDDQMLKKVFSNQRAVGELRLMTKKGDIRWVRVYAQPVWDESQNRLVRIYGAVQDITNGKQAEETLRQRDAILQVVAHAAQVFLQSSNWRENINQTLDELGRVTDASHVYLFENHKIDDRLYTSQRYEWVSPKAAPEIDNPKYQNVPLFGDGEKYWHGILSAGRTFVGNMDALPKEEADYFLGRGIKSILDVPIFVKGEWWGVVGFDDYFNERGWSPAEIEALEIAAKMISAAISSEQINESIRASEQQYRELFEQSQDGISIMTLDRKIIRWNKRLNEMMGGEILPGGDAVTNVSSIDEDDAKRKFIQTVSGIKVPIYERTFIREDNTAFVAEVNLTLVRDANGNPWYVQSILRDVTERKKAEQNLRANEEKVRELNSSLENRVEERTKQLSMEKAKIEQVVNEVAALRTLSDFLQSSLTVEEASSIVASHMGSLFPKTSGGLFLVSDGFVDLALVSSWGDFKTETVIQPNDCWGMRRGRPFARHISDSSPLCTHFDGNIPNESLCLPLMGQNEIIGMLSLQVSGEGEKYFTHDMQNLAIASADSIALALANLRLRERLHNETIRDSLTGIFNRRFMEETLEREVHRAERNQEPLCVIMFEIDDFRQYNNTFGHDAGDYVLKRVVDTMSSKLRRSDFPCRYGGDEFTLLLPGTSLADGARRADDLRKAIEELALSFNNRALGQVTVRMGVAAYPKHGESGEAVLKVADEASYRARAIGKNCVIVAD